MNMKQKSKTAGPVRYMLPAAVIFITTALFLSSCAPAQVTPPPPDENVPQDEIPGSKEDPVAEKPPDYQALGVNELGEIMILMYHQIADTEDEWVRTPANFRKDLQALYDAGYRLIPMNDLLDGNIEVPAGKSPVVLTFDDGSSGQFRYIEKDGQLVIDPNSAVGIMEEFYQQNPEFGLAATFYLFYVTPPFGQPDYLQQKLAYLAERGFEIGNHTYAHPSLRGLAPEVARKELAYQVKWTQHYLPGYKVRSLALPYGAHPDEISYIVRGSYEGIDYHNEGILLVGANPAPSPFHINFNPHALPRIRASEMMTEGVGIYEWMERLQEAPQNRYISDGNPDTVAIPASLAGQVREEALDGKTLVTYPE